MAAILVIDSSPTIRETLRIVLGAEHALATAPSWDDVPHGTRADVVIFGVAAGPRDDARLASARARLAPDAPLLLLNSPAEVDARALVPHGHRIAFLPKPFDAHGVRTGVAALLRPEPRSTPSDHVVSWHRRWVEPPYLTAGAAMLARRASLTDLPVLLLGEHGSGAVEIAQAIHFFSGRGGSVLVRRARELDSEMLVTPAAIGALVIENAPELSAATQASLATLLRDPEEAIRHPRVFATSSIPLDTVAASGAFAPVLAQMLSALPIVLAPLRDRTADIPALVAAFAAALATRLRLEPVVFTEAALTRLQHYLWFGNLAELEAVIARTLAVHRPRVVEPEMLVFGIDDAARLVTVTAVDEPTPAIARSAERLPVMPAEPVTAPPTRPRVVPLERRRPEETGTDIEPAPVATRPSRDDGAPDPPTLEVLLGELANELRNPMVTIKTFAQHLDSVVDDSEVRARFATLAGDAITRMDALLETLLDFARFRSPTTAAIDLGALLTRALDDRAGDLARKDVRVERAAADAGAILVAGDEHQVLFALRSLVDVLVRDLVAHTPIRITARSDGSLEVAASVGRSVATRLAGYVDNGQHGEASAPPPLALAIAAALLRRNGGRLHTRTGADDATVVTVSLPRTAAHRQA